MHIGMAYTTIQDLDLYIIGAGFPAFELEWGYGRCGRLGGITFRGLHKIVLKGYKCRCKWLAAPGMGV
jgi:hypothetical protein